MDMEDRSKMAIKVCDSIMGSGKSSAVIKNMNDHPEKHYIYSGAHYEGVPLAPV